MEQRVHHPPRSRRWRAALTEQVGFWRVLIEMTLLGNGLVLLLYPLTPLIGSPWTEIISYTSLAVYVLPAWRLRPGTGNLLRRGARILAWMIVFGLLNGLISWAYFHFLPPQGRFLGIRTEDMRMPLVVFLLIIILFTASLFLPSRVVVTLWMAGRTRLRWQLTSSFLVVALIATLLIPLGLGIVVGISSLSIEPLLISPHEAAERATSSVTPLVRRGTAPSELTAVLSGLLDGTTRIPVPSDQRTDETPGAASFNGVRRLTVLSPDGQVLASAGNNAFPLGQPLAPSQMPEVMLLLEQVRGGGCTNGRPADGMITDSAACAITDENGTPLAALLVESNINSTAQVGAAFGRIIAASLLSGNLAFYILPVSGAVILPLALGLGYLIARRVTRRIERLATAVSDIAAGNLRQRVPLDSGDEIGRLSADFNTMASRLEERERALQTEKERAERLLDANRHLVANVSHELRTPLATLRGYLEALEQTHGAQLPQHDMAVIQGEIQRLTALIDDLFTLARAEAQQLPLQIEPVDAAMLIKRLTGTLAPLARRERQIEVVSKLPDNLPLVCADRTRLEQVLLNLAHNALRHTPAGGIIVFDGAVENGHVTIAVADTGVGIPADELPFVFERFYRGDSSRTRETGGAGLGLALVQELVTAMDGTVAVESTPGRGSRFSVVLRRAP